MTIHARGYRRYEGGFVDRSPASVIFREGYRIAFKSLGFKILGILLLVIYVVVVAILFFTINFSELFARGGDFDFGRESAELLVQMIQVFYGFAGLIGTIVVILSGAGLVADDIRTRGLALYLVRPIRPIDYVLGKTMILPALLAWCLLLPGVFMFLLTGLWQPSGTTLAWMGDNSIILTTVLRYYVAAAAGYTGVMMILSSLLEKRGWIRVIAVGVILGGGMLVGLSMLIRGTGGKVLRYFSVSDNAGAGFIELLLEYRGEDGIQFPTEMLPDPNVALGANVLVLLVGMGLAWRRAQSVEVSG